MEAAYGPISNLNIVSNSTGLDPSNERKQNFVLAAGRWWDEGKNGAVLDAAAAMTRWPVKVAGANRGPNGQSLQFRNADHCGELSRERMMVLARQAAIVVSPSIYEPFGLAALEAARAGAALVLSDIPTYREIWNDAALFVDPHHPKAFADAFNHLADDSLHRVALGLKAQERSARFSLKAQAQAMCGIYSGTLGHAFSTAAE